MPPSRGDTICGHVVIDALAPMQFGARAFGPVYLAHTPEEPRLWLTAIDRTLLPRSYDVSRFMAGVGELLHVSVPGAVDVVLVDREADFCVVGHRADPRARTLATLAESGADERGALELGTTLAHTLAELHLRGMLHGLLTPATVVRAGQRWMTWQHGIVKWCVPDRLGPRLRPPGGDPIAPEIRAGEPSAPASDVFAWGAAVACLLTGAVGSEAITLLEIDGREDPLHALVRRCLEPIPELRPQDGAQLLQRLEAIARATPRGGEWEEDSGEVSFAELFDDLDPATSSTTADAAARREVTSLREELVELFDIEAEEYEPPAPEPPPTVAAVSPVPVAITSPVVETPSWRELAERYVAEVRLTARTDDRPPPRVEERPPPRPSDEAIAASTSASDLARVALVRARVRTGPSRPVRADPSATSGEWMIPDEPDDEPEYPPPCDPDAPALPSGVRVPEVDGDEPPLYAFPDPETGEIIIAGPDWKPHAAEEPEPAGVDDTPRLVPMPGPPSRLVAPAQEVSRAPAVRRSGAVPVVDARPRADASQRLALVLATIGAVAAIGMTVSAAQDAGGFGKLFGEVTESRSEATTSVASVAEPREPATTCPPAMAPLSGTTCIDRGEFPGVGEMPRTHVSLAEAEHACSDRGMRLCTQGEWRTACRGDADLDHPYGATADPGACNGAVAGAPTATLEASGSRPACVNAAGVFDLEGNVAEWVEGGAAMGGDAMTPAPSCARRAEPGADTRAPTLGFRCCASASAPTP